MPRLLVKSFFDAESADFGKTLFLRAEPMSAASMFPRPKLDQVVGQSVLIWKSEENCFWGSGTIHSVKEISDDPPKGITATQSYMTWRVEIEIVKRSAKSLHPSELEIPALVLSAANDLKKALKQPFDKIVTISDETGAVLDLLLARPE